MSGLLKIITPINLETEEAKFLKSKTYDPTFLYNWNNSEIDLYIQNFPQRASLVKAILKQNHSRITKKAERVFLTEIEKSTLRQAKKITKPDHLRLRHPSINRVLKAFDRALKYFDLDYKVVVSAQGGFNVRPKQSQNLIIISKSLSLHFFSVDGLIKHEMSHVIRYENGEFNKIKRSLDYLPTEEGLSSYVQDYGGRWGQKSRYQHAAEYVASSIGKDGSLRDIFNFFRSLDFPKKMAWQRASRHKFGFVDTSKPGDIIKPAMYFHHSQKIKKLTSTQRLKLYSGKISTEDLKKIKTYKGKFSSKQIKHFFNI